MKPIYKEAYPHLFEPLILGKKKVEIKNRVFTAPMGVRRRAGPTDSP